MPTTSKKTKTAPKQQTEAKARKPRKSLTTEDKISQVKSDIEKKSSELKALKASLKELEALKGKEEIADLVSLMKKSGKTKEEVRSFFES